MTGSIIRKQFNNEMCYRYDNMSAFARSFDAHMDCCPDKKYCDKHIMIMSRNRN